MSAVTKSEANHKWNYWLLSSLILAAIPAIGYALAFVYELAYCGFFGIPSEFILISWTNLLLAISSFLGYSIIVFTVFWFPLILRYLNIVGPGIIEKKVLAHVAVLSLFTALYLRYRSIEPDLIIVYFLPLWRMFTDFVVPLITQRKVQGYRNKLEAEHEPDLKETIKVPNFIRRYLISALFIVFVLSILFAVAYFEGKRSAMVQEDFLVPSTYPQSVVLKLYGDNLICAPLNTEGNYIQREFFFINLSNDPNLRLTLQKIGPLKSCQ